MFNIKKLYLFISGMRGIYKAALKELSSFYICFILKYAIFILFWFITALCISFILACTYAHNLYKQFFIVFILYFFINIWFYFYNIYSFSKYTSSVQRFWKRTFMLFWVIEFFLFSIFLYLLFISPEEPYYTYSSTKSNYTQLDPILSGDILFVCAIILSSISSISVFFIKYGNAQANPVIYFILFFIFTWLFIKEFFRFLDCFYFISKLSLVSCVSFVNYGYLSVVYEGDYANAAILNESAFMLDALFAHKTKSYFAFILCFLKFWHIVFIYAIFIISLVPYITSGIISFDSAAILCQNFIYVVLFSTLPYITYSVSFFSVIFSKPYLFLDNGYFFNSIYLLNELILIF